MNSVESTVKGRTAAHNRVQLAKLLVEADRRRQYNKIDTLFPDEGPYRRELYPKHIQFMNKGSQFPQRAFIAANRTGKTVDGAYEMVCHASGIYPHWWKGKRFDEPISAWAASVNNSATRDIIQHELLGPNSDIGSGLIPKHLIDRPSMNKAGVPGAVETIYVKHISGGVSEVGLKSYEQGRDTFQGTKKQVIWLDEEPTDPNIYSECLTRTAGGGGEDGIIYCTFTPLLGLSKIAMSFLPDGKFPEGGSSPEDPYKFVTQVSWEEVPHLSEEWKAQALAAYSDHEREARSRGIPSLGSGAIFPVSESTFVIEPFQMPVWWPKAYGIDFGWANPTAVIWGAKDPQSGILYLYSEHSQAKVTAPLHASAIKARGHWMTGAGDPAGFIGSGPSGNCYAAEYAELDLDLMPSPGGPNSKDARIAKVLTLLETGMLKVSSALVKFMSEYRIYRRGENGKIVKNNDHLMDATQYLICEFDNICQMPPDPDAESDNHSFGASNANPVTGY